MQESNNNLKEHPDLYKRSIKGGYWVFAIKAATQLLGIVKSVLVFNLLLGNNLKVVVIANLIMAGLNTFTESGFREALIQKKENIEEYLDTAWVIGILRGFFLFIVIFFTAPVFASLLTEQELIPLAVSVIRAMGICFLITAFHNIGVVYFQKELQFHKTFGLTMVGALVDIIVSIVLVLIYKNVWVIVIARLVSVIINMLMSYILCSYRPKFHYVPEKARELWRFGKWLFSGKIIGYLLNEGDDWFVGFYLGADLLTIYRYAYRFSLMPATHILKPIAQVTFPAFSKIQSDLPRLREAYFKVLRATSLVAFPLSFFIFSIGPDFVRLFLTEEASDLAVPLQILAIAGLISSRGSIGPPVLKATGKVKLILHLQLFRLLLLASLIYPCTKMWGICGTAIAIALVRLIMSFPGMFIIGKLLKSSMWDMIEPSVIPLCASFTIILSSYIFKNYVFAELTKFTFCLLSFLLLNIYILSLYVLHRLIKGRKQKIFF